MTDLQLSGMETLLAITGLAIFILSVILFLRRYLKSQSNNKRNSDDLDQTSISSRVKRNNVNVFIWSKPIFLFGLSSAITFTLLAFSWTTYEQAVYIPDTSEYLDDIMLIETPRTPPPKPPPPPPPPPKIDVIEEPIPEDETPKFIDTTIDAYEAIEDPVIEVAKAPAPTPAVLPPPPDPPEEPIVRFAEQMPRFPGCEDMVGTHKEKEVCAQMKLLKYIYKNLKYPQIAIDNGIEGTTVIQFVVDKKGNITNVDLKIDIGGGCGPAAVKAVKSMNNQLDNWTPGKQNGRPVKVLFTLPIKFDLK
ncbi:MAG: TonB family protein [Bacteroidia bacterium]|nr:TonB family protein [Bacteroidia bacterium]